MSDTAAKTEVDPKLLEILVCPVTKGPLTYDRNAGELISRAAGLAYPVRATAFPSCCRTRPGPWNDPARDHRGPDRNPRSTCLPPARSGLRWWAEFQLPRRISPGGKPQCRGPGPLPGRAGDSAGQSPCRASCRWSRSAIMPSVSTFDDGHDTGIFTWDYLVQLGQEHDVRWERYLQELAVKGFSRELPPARR